jgi:Tfp pilus assembly protein PilX
VNIVTSFGAELRLSAAEAYARARGDERGIALAIAIPILAVITIMLFTALHLGAASSRSSSYSDSGQKAFHLAEAGVNNALAVLADDGNDPSNVNLLAARTTTYSGGTVTWSGTLSGDIWTITGTSSVPNPTGAAPITRTVTRKAKVTSGIPIEGNEAWNYVYMDSESECLLLQNTVTVSAPLYVRGNLCLKNSASYRGPEMNVRGTVQTDDSATVGLSTAPVPLVRVEDGCRYTSSGGFAATCGPTQKVWATEFNNTPPNYSKPPDRLAESYLAAKPGPKKYCTSGSFPGGASSFDNDSSRNGSGPAVDIMPSTAYDCTVTEFGNTVGRIAWTPGSPASSPGTLIVEGTIFFDGELVMSDSRSAVYTGKGNIYVSKKIKMDNSRQICAVASCNTSTWNPNTNFLLLVSGASDIPAIEMNSSARFQGGMYAVGGFKLQNSAMMQGPVIANVVDVQNSGFSATWPPLTELNDGMPSNGSGETTVELLPDWSG